MIPQTAKTVKSLIPENPTRILCFYSNATPRLQIVRIVNIPNFHFERVVFPQQRLMFDAVPTAQLEIQTFQGDGAIVTKLIACDRLRVEDSVSNTYSNLIASWSSPLEKQIKPAENAGLMKSLCG